jgi:tripartite-type tricarboxylate transporter receptor subunit TctC
LSESRIWKEKYIKENMLTPDYTASTETYKLWEAQSNMYAQIMKEMGIIK